MAIVAPVQNGELVKSKTNEDEKATGNKLGYDQFLQLLCAEMQYQDPLEPTSNTEYVAQLATFSQMEATLNMQSSLESSNANSLVGKYVIVKATSSTTGETVAEAGFVDYVQYENGKMYFSVNGKNYTQDEIYQVADTDYMEAVTLASTFANYVKTLPSKDDLTASDKESLDKLTKVFESMNDYQKSYIDANSLKKYNELVEKMKELCPETDGDKDDTGKGDENKGEETKTV